jgi:phospholipase C
VRIAAILLAVAACLVGAVPASATTTPIHHLVVIFDENVSFDHYFATYPYATNPAGQPAFHAKAGTPAVNGLSGSLLTANPNSANPFRFDRSQAATCDNNHSYTAEQRAFDGGLMDKFVQYTSCPSNATMGYFDGNTVTALWNYAQHYTLSDNFFGTVFGPSTPGALNLISGNTHGASPDIAGSVVGGTVIADPDPLNDQCGNRNAAADISFGTANNIGTLLSAHNVTWGWFQGGFRPTGSDAGGAVCGSQHTNVANATVRDYSAHHEPFQYYSKTANPTHKAPASPADIGQDDPPAAVDKVNHQYDLTDFGTALSSGYAPAVSFLKPPAYADGHGGYSNPLDEQRFIVNTINAIQASSIWPDTAIVVAYDDSDGWYDHVASPIVNSSTDPTLDQLDGPGECQGPGATPPPVAGNYQLRCGFGPRLPLLAISPFARQNNVSHTAIDQTSILRFIEDNWGTGQLGDSSFDNIPSPKPSIANLLDFSAGAPKAPRVTVNPDTGVVTHVESFDTDGDGVPNSSDACPGVSDLGAPRSPRNGCPRNRPTAGDDVLTGNAAANVICGLLGNDVLNGLGGADTLYGDACGARKVHISAATGGNDVLNGGSGNDKLFGAGGNDKLNGGAGKDKLIGGAGKDALTGGAGNDTLSGGSGKNSYSAGSGNDTVNARNKKRETVNCGSGKKDRATVDKRDRTKGCEKVKRR